MGGGGPIQLQKTIHTVIWDKFCEAGSALRRTAGSGSAKNEFGSTALVIDLGLEGAAPPVQPRKSSFYIFIQYRNAFHPLEVLMFVC